MPPEIAAEFFVYHVRACLVQRHGVRACKYADVAYKRGAFGRVAVAEFGYVVKEIYREVRFIFYDAEGVFDYLFLCGRGVFIPRYFEYAGRTAQDTFAAARAFFFIENDRFVF